MRVLKGLLIIIGLAALLVGGYCAFHAASGRMDIAATGEHNALTSRLIQGARQAAVSRSARDIEVRLPDLDNQDVLFEAVAGFDDMCAVCHTPPGGSPTAVARGLNPPATDLAWSGANRSPAELLWVTRHGIRMTGMPAWGPTHSDAELWPIVALITRFPDFADEDYGRLLQAAREAGVEHVHHNGEEHDHGNDHHHDHHHEHNEHNDPAHNSEDHDEHHHQHH